jgi:SAM-dependent methyltransferase
LRIGSRCARYARGSRPVLPLFRPELFAHARPDSGSDDLCTASVDFDVSVTVQQSFRREIELEGISTIPEACESLEYVACPICSGWGHRLLFERLDHTHQASDVRFRIVQCRLCSFVFINPRPTLAGIAQYYPPEFYETGVSADALLMEKSQTLEARLRLVGNVTPGRLLDVGCQKGEFIYVMRRRGWEVEGVEFSRTPPNLFAMPIFYGALGAAPFAAESFDLITLWAVLEHVHDPVGMLTLVRRFLKPTGRAYVLVPNFNSIPARFMRHDDVPRHLVMFTKRTFREAAGRAGLRVRRFVFGDDIFSGSTRGILNFLWKLLHGETYDEILSQNRSAARWDEFTSRLRSRESSSMRQVDKLDLALTPWLDRLMNRMSLGFIMTAELELAHSDGPKCPRS